MTGNYSILVVDDESESLLLLTDLLAAAGYRVRSANSGRLALASAKASQPHLILVDIHIPDIDGFELCRRFKSEVATRQIPLIFISGAGEVEERVAGLALGAVDYIGKPFLREELLARVRTHLELGRLRSDLELQMAARTQELHATIERLRESEERFRNMADSAPVMIWISAPNKLCTFFNSGWLSFTGRSMEQELGDGWAAGVHPDDLERVVKVYSSSFDARRSFEIEYRLRRADGEYRWILDRGAPRCAAAGEFAGYIGTAIDITDLRRTQEEALSREKLDSLAVLTRGIAHDFNNLMGSILAEAEVADAELDQGLSPREELRQIKRVAVRASEVVRELMIYSGQEHTSFETVKLSALVEEMLELLRVSISKRAVLHVDLRPDLPAVRGNPTQIRQIVMNLIINASQAIGEAHGEICVRTSLAPNSPHDYVRLEISDTGCGISDEERAKIFDPFFTRKPGGHGLGLAVVQGIVAAHKGVINVMSKPGKGATFEVLLPLAETLAESPAPFPATAAPESARALRGAVLLVEDEDTLQLATSKALRKRGFSVLVARDGWAAVELFRAHADQIGVVLLDLTLPGIPGREVLRQIRAIKRDVRVVLTSAYDQNLPPNAKHSELPSAFLRKPYGVADLVRGLEAACSAPPQDLAS
uniref:histidine kinase n=1 Tax=Solibacter usitatus (strain Ellin6076) TaxID=234267 RepID=Q023Q2_SOLUE